MLEIMIKIQNKIKKSLLAETSKELNWKILMKYISIKMKQIDI